MRVALAARPPPPAVLEYVGALCAQRSTASGSRAAGRLVEVLLERLDGSAEPAVVDAMARQVLGAAGDVPLAEYMPGAVARLPAHWRAALRLVNDLSDAGAALFARLVAAAPLEQPDVPRDELKALLARVDAASIEAPTPAILAVRSATAALFAALDAPQGAPSRRALETATQDAFEAPTRAVLEASVSPLGVWSAHGMCTYASTLQLALRQARSSGGGRHPALPAAPAIGAEVVFLVDLLAGIDVDWADKCRAAQGVLAARKAHAVCSPTCTHTDGHAAQRRLRACTRDVPRWGTCRRGLARRRATCAHRTVVAECRRWLGTCARGLADAAPSARGASLRRTTAAH